MGVRLRPGRLFRVFPYVAAARRGHEGSPLWRPTTQGSGRVDNPERYLVLYAADSAVGAIQERYARYSEWSEAMLASPSWPEARAALAELEADIDVLDLDDAKALARRSIRPSRIVTRDRSVTQRWALDVFEDDRWAGVRWWSSLDADRGSYGLWSVDGLRVRSATPLDAKHPAIQEAAETLARRWV